MYREIPCIFDPVLPNVVTSCVTIVQYQNQELTLVQSTEFIQISPAVHVFVGGGVDLCSHYHDQELCFCQKASLCYPIIATPLFSHHLLSLSSH